MSDKDNIIPFPSLKVSNLSKQRLKAEQLTEEMKKTKAFDLCNHLSEAVMMAGAKELALNGFKVQDPEFLKDFSFALAPQINVDTNCSFLRTIKSEI